jgi:hypothetical protein
VARHPGGRPTKYKKKYCREITEWIDQDADRAKEEFETSAVEVVGILRAIETALGTEHM